ncbi:hypothetical protein SDC9_97847 [bioreactor metagenome]|uniref:Uncharacterized protein n=1 Tax=bioreactor metagenome TaxID=1076179 RepID=A0A645AFP8_9ZZZZ
MGRAVRNQHDRKLWMALGRFLQSTFQPVVHSARRPECLADFERNRCAGFHALRDIFPGMRCREKQHRYDDNFVHRPFFERFDRILQCLLLPFQHTDRLRQGQCVSEIFDDVGQFLRDAGLSAVQHIHDSDIHLIPPRNRPDDFSHYNAKDRRSCRPSVFF